MCLDEDGSGCPPFAYYDHMATVLRGFGPSVPVRQLMGTTLMDCNAIEASIDRPRIQYAKFKAQGRHDTAASIQDNINRLAQRLAPGNGPAWHRATCQPCNRSTATGALHSLRQRGAAQGNREGG